MSKKNRNYTEKNPFLMVLYMIAAAALIGCLVWLVMRSRQRSAEYVETVTQLAMDETEYERESHRETESETESEKEARTAQSETSGEETSEGQEESSLQLSNVKDASILVLNGTERSGVAGYWKTQLEEGGYTNVTPASYQQSSSQTTVYTDNELCAEELKKIFPDAVYQTGTPEGGYTFDDSVEKPEEVDVYIVIGTDNSDYEETA